MGSSIFSQGVSQAASETLPQPMGEASPADATMRSVGAGNLPRWIHPVACVVRETAGGAGVAATPVSADAPARPRPRRVGPRDRANGISLYPMRLPTAARRDYSKGDLAVAAEMFLKLKCGGDVRDETVSAVREAVDRQEYENALKIEVAVERLLADLDV